MRQRLDQIAAATGLELIGDGSVEVSGLSHPAAAGADHLAIALNPDYAEAVVRSSCQAAVVWAGAELEALGLKAALIAGHPRRTLGAMTQAFQPELDIPRGTHPTAQIDDGAEIGDGAAIGAFTIIGAGARIGRNAQIADHVSIGRDAVIGDDVVLHSGVRIGARCRIGDAVTVHQNSVIGADGFSFEPLTYDLAKRMRGAEAPEPPNDMADAEPMRIHSLAAVEIGDRVEIGACTTIDRGTLVSTRVGRFTKIDNQVQIGHNVRVGEAVMLCAQVGLAGSVTVGDRSVLGGKVGVGDHLKIGSDVLVAGGSLIGRSIADGQVMIGVPAMPRRDFEMQLLALRRLPRMLAQLGEIKKKLGL